MPQLPTDCTDDDLCPGCRRPLSTLLRFDAVWRADGTLELVFCVCGTALDLRVAEPYLPRSVLLYVEELSDYRH